VSEESWGRTTSRAIAWSTVAFVLGRGLSFISVLVLVRILSPADFGVLAAVLVVISLLELAGDLGMKATVVYEQEHGVTDRVRTAFSMNIALAIALSGAGVLLAPAVADFFHQGSHAGLFRLAALNPLITGLGNVHDGVLLRDLRLRERVGPQFQRSLVRAVVSIALAAAGMGPASLVIGFLAGTAAWTASLWRIIPLRPSLKLDPAAARGMLAYGGAASALEVLAVISSRADSVVIGRILGSGALGLYTVAFRVPELMIDSASWNISIVAFPALSRQRVADRAGLGAASLSIMRYCALYALPMGAGIAILSQPIITVLFSERWAPAAGVMSAVAVLSAFGALVFPLGDVFKALGRQPRLVALTVASIPVAVTAMAVVAPAGIVAVAWARTCVAAVQLVVQLTMIAHAVPIRPRDILVALRPGAITAAGVAAGALAVHEAWPGPDAGSLVVAVLAAAAGGVIALRAGAPEVYTELRGHLAGLRMRTRPALQNR
jgi:lipopolysaccharide exporter